MSVLQNCVFLFTEITIIIVPKNSGKIQFFNLLSNNEIIGVLGELQTKQMVIALKAHSYDSTLV